MMSDFFVRGARLQAERLGDRQELVLVLGFKDGLFECLSGHGYLSPDAIRGVSGLDAERCRNCRHEPALMAPR